jgi:hypothetical protein
MTFTDHPRTVSDLDLGPLGHVTRTAAQRLSEHALAALAGRHLSDRDSRSSSLEATLDGSVRIRLRPPVTVIARGAASY